MSNKRKHSVRKKLPPAPNVKPPAAPKSKVSRPLPPRVVKPYRKLPTKRPTLPNLPNRSAKLPQLPKSKSKPMEEIHKVSVTEVKNHPEDKKEEEFLAEKVVTTNELLTEPNSFEKIDTDDYEEEIEREMLVEERIEDIEPDVISPQKPTSKPENYTPSKPSNIPIPTIETNVTEQPITSINEFIDRPRSPPSPIKREMSIASHQDRPFDDTTSDEDEVFLEKYREQIEAEKLKYEKQMKEEEEAIIKKVEDMFNSANADLPPLPSRPISLSLAKHEEELKKQIEEYEKKNEESKVEEKEEEEDVIETPTKETSKSPQKAKEEENEKTIHLNINIPESDKILTEEEREEQEELKKIEKQKNFIFDEFIKTEEEYVTHLHELNHYYIQPLHETILSGSTKIITKEKHQEIFNLFQTIVPINILFLEELSASRISDMHRDYNLFFRAVIKFSPCFKLYVQFINKFDSINIAMLEEERKNTKFRIFCRNVSSTMVKKSYRINNLESFLVLPVQRIPRYRLLLKNMLELETRKKSGGSSDTSSSSTSSNSSIRTALLENAYNSISRLTEYCNEERKRVSRALRMKELSELLDIKDLIQPHRQLILEQKDLSVVVKGKIMVKTKCTLYIFSDLFVVLVYHPTNYFVQQFTSESSSMQTIAIALDTNVRVKHEKEYLEEYVFSVSTNYYSRMNKMRNLNVKKKRSELDAERINGMNNSMEDLNVEIFCGKDLEMMSRLMKAVQKQTNKNRVSRRISVKPKKEKKKKKRKILNLSGSRGLGEEYDLLSSIIAGELSEDED